MMRAMVIEGSDGGEPTIVERDLPGPNRVPGQVTIKVAAASVNRADLAVRKAGASPYTSGDGPVIAGLDCAGIVVDADDDGPLAVGDRVMTFAPGGLAEYVVTDARMPIVMPHYWTFVQGAASIVALLTAHNALRTAGRLAPGESVLVTAARSAAGQAVVKLARALGASGVYAGVRTVRDEEFLLGLGADVVVPTGVDGFGQDLWDRTGGHGVDVVIDHVGAPCLPELVTASAIGARIVSVGRLGGGRATIDLETVALKRLELIGVTFRTRAADERAAAAQAFRDDLSAALARTDLTARVDRVLPWTDVLEAQAAMSADSHVGKIVLRLDANI